MVPRLLGTLSSAFQPTRTAPAFAQDAIRPAALFALVVALPLALLDGVIPFTHRLTFVAMRVDLRGGPSPIEIALDVGQAMLLSLILNSVALVTLALPYVSLTRAYSAAPRSRAAYRVILYRYWLLPLGAIILALFAWFAPDASGQVIVAVAQIASLVPVLLFYLSLYATARLACGVGPLASLVAVSIPFTVVQITHWLALQLLDPWLPRAVVSPGVQ